MLGDYHKIQVCSITKQEISVNFFYNVCNPATQIEMPMHARPQACPAQPKLNAIAQAFHRQISSSRSSTSSIKSCTRLSSISLFIDLIIIQTPYTATACATQTSPLHSNSSRSDNSAIALSMSSDNSVLRVITFICTSHSLCCNRSFYNAIVVASIFAIDIRLYCICLLNS